MAFTTTSNFSGKAAGFYIAAALKEAKSLEYLTMIGNVKFKSNIQRMAGSGMIADATCDFTDAGTLALTEKVFRFTTDMLKQGMYSTGWDSYQTISNNYGNMVRAYENYVRDAAQFEKEKKDDKNFDSWRRDYVAGRAGEVKGYYTELVKKAKIVMNKDNYKPIAK